MSKPNDAISKLTPFKMFRATATRSILVGMLSFILISYLTYHIMGMHIEEDMNYLNYLRTGSKEIILAAWVSCSLTVLIHTIFRGIFKELSLYAKQGKAEIEAAQQALIDEKALQEAERMAREQKEAEGGAEQLLIRVFENKFEVSAGKNKNPRYTSALMNGVSFFENNGIYKLEMDMRQAKSIAEDSDTPLIDDQSEKDVTPSGNVDLGKSNA